MTDTEAHPTGHRVAKAAAIVLAVAVALGALFVGAPPRFSSPDGGAGSLARFLTSLAPLAILQAAVAVALGLLVAGECLRRESPGLPGCRVAARTRLPLLLLLAYGLAQLVPLPAGVLGVVAPFSARTYESLAAAGDETMRPMSLWPSGTAYALFNLAGMIAASTAVWTLVRAGRPRWTAAVVLVFVAAVATLESVHGLQTTKLGDDLLLGTFAKISGAKHVTGTFVHQTMMAVWAGMGACAALGLEAASASARPRRGVAFVPFAAAAVCVVAGFFTISRLGWLGIAAGVLVTWLLVARSLGRDGRRAAAWSMGGAALVLVAVAVIAAIVVPAFRERIGYLFTDKGVEDPRFPIWSSTMALFREAPVVGTGLGSFGRAIRLTQSVDCPLPLWFAHSDPLNVLSDVGVLGAVLVLWWVVAMVRRGLPALRSADARTRCLAAGAFGAAVVVLVASLGDFQTQFAVVAIPFAALFTLPAALADAESSAAAEDEPRAWFLPPKALAATALVVACAVAALPLFDATRRWRELRDPGVTGATRADALVAQAGALIGTVKTAKDPKSVLAAAEAKVREAARLDPLFDEAHFWTGMVALFRGEPRDDVFRALGRARLVAHGSAATNLRVGTTYLDLVGTAGTGFGPPGDGALPALREAGELDPKAFSVAWAAGLAHGFSLDELRAITPERGHAQITLFEHLRTLGHVEEAIDVLKEQLARDPWDLEVSTRLAAALRDAGREAEGRAWFAGIGAEWPK